MKLRIRGNSIRLRVQRLEVVRLAKDGRLEEVTEFASGQCFRYALSVDPNRESIFADFNGFLLEIYLPTRVAEKWAQGDLISIHEDVQLLGGKTLRLLIEKDFQCLKPRSHWNEDESDAYANPNTFCGESVPHG